MNTHLLPVPFEIAELINSFAYYDWKTWMRLEREKRFMKDLIHRMRHCYVSPMYPNEYHDDNTLLIWLAIPPCLKETQFQPCFCKKCGNYVYRKPFCTC